MAHVVDRWRQSDRKGKGKRWLARYTDPSGRERARAFDRKVDAERFLTTLEADKLKGSYVDPNDRTTVGEYSRRWFDARPYRPSSAKRIDSMIRTHIEGTRLGDRRLAAVQPSEVQAWVTDRAKVLHPTTLRQLVSLLRSIYASAVLDRLVGTTPAVRLQVPRFERERIVPLTVEQVRALAAAMPERNRAMVITQAGLGLRIGELLALRLEDVDFLRRTARVEWQITTANVRGEPKTPRSRRTVPLPQVVAEALSEHLRAFPAGDDGSLFVTPLGAPHKHNTYGSVTFPAAVKRAKLPPGTTSHDLRHHYASVLLAAGESVVAVAERLGHEDASLVLSTYGHLMPNTEDRTRRAVDEAWSSASADGPATDQESEVSL